MVHGQHLSGYGHSETIEKMKNDQYQKKKSMSLPLKYKNCAQWFMMA